MRRSSRVDLQAALGQVVDGDFELLRALGSGSHADVFLAQQRSVGRRQVAVKALSYLYLKLPERDVKKASQALQREAELLGRMRSPCYVDVYRCGTMADGRPYIAMQYAEGMTLQQALAGLNAAGKRMTSDRVAEVIGQWADGLAELHALGWVHRDVTPANAAVSDNINGAMQLLTYDLGAATQLNDKADRFRVGWDKDNPAGTPAYMAPEQARGDVVDGRADQYSLACIAYELLAGSRVLGGGRHPRRRSAGSLALDAGDSAAVAGLAAARSAAERHCGGAPSPGPRSGPALWRCQKLCPSSGHRPPSRQQRTGQLVVAAVATRRHAVKGWLANLSVLVAALAGILATLYAVRALFLAQLRAPKATAKAERPDPDQKELARLEDERRRLLNHLREIQFDYDTGKLDTHDYNRLRVRYEGEAIAVLALLDAHKRDLAAADHAATHGAPARTAGGHR